MEYSDHRCFFLNFRFNYGALISEIKVGYRSSKTKCVVFFMRNVVLDVKQKYKNVFNTVYSLFFRCEYANELANNNGYGFGLNLHVSTKTIAL